MQLFKRTRRTRNNALIRDLISDVNLSMNDFIYPLFIEEGNNIKSEIEAMPNQFRYSIDKLKEEIEDIINLGIKGILLFGIPKQKDEKGFSLTYNIRCPILHVDVWQREAYIVHHRAGYPDDGGYSRSSFPLTE